MGATQPAPDREHAGALEFAFRGRSLERPIYLSPDEERLFGRWLQILNGTGVPYALGGAYANYAYTGIWRDSKDLDAFLQPRDVMLALQAFTEAGFLTEVRDRYWLAKVHSPPHLFDLLFAVRHMSRLRITEGWLDTSLPARFLGEPTRLLGPEELLSSKVYVANRDRYDGADILHLMHSLRGTLDWRRIIDLLEGDDEILLWHLLLFTYVYPGHRDWLPLDLMRRTFDRMTGDQALHARAFRGLVLDPLAFEVDVADWGHDDDRDDRPLLDAEGKPL